MLILLSSGTCPWGLGEPGQAHGLVKGSSKPQLGPPEDLTQAHKPFWESFPVHPRLAFLLSILKRVCRAPRLPHHRLFMWKEGWGALHDQSYLNHAGWKDLPPFLGIKYRQHMAYKQINCMPRAQLRGNVEKAPWGGGRKAQLREED